MKFEYLLWFLFGAIFGSVANALIYRIPRGLSWVHGRSICPFCRHKLGRLDLIPIISYLALSGRCRYCSKPIGMGYLITELLMGSVLFLVSVIGLPFLDTIFLTAIFFILYIISIIDWQTKKIFDGTIFVLATLIIGYFFWVNFPIGRIEFADVTLGSLIGTVIIGGIWLISRGRAMGSGDIGLQAVLGIGLGVDKALVGLWIAFVSGAIVGGYQILFGRMKLRSEIAFGPFLIFGAVVAYIWGEHIIELLF